MNKNQPSGPLPVIVASCLPRPSTFELAPGTSGFKWDRHIFNGKNTHKNALKHVARTQNKTPKNIQKTVWLSSPPKQWARIHALSVRLIDSFSKQKKNYFCWFSSDSPTFPVRRISCSSVLWVTFLNLAVCLLDISSRCQNGPRSSVVRWRPRPLVLKITGGLGCFMASFWEWSEVLIRREATRRLSMPHPKSQENPRKWRLPAGPAERTSSSLTSCFLFLWQNQDFGSKNQPLFVVVFFMYALRDTHNSQTKQQVFLLSVSSIQDSCLKTNCCQTFEILISEPSSPIFHANSNCLPYLPSKYNLLQTSNVRFLKRRNLRNIGIILVWVKTQILWMITFATWVLWGNLGLSTLESILRGMFEVSPSAVAREVLVQAPRWLFPAWAPTKPKDKLNIQAASN